MLTPAMAVAAAAGGCTAGDGRGGSSVHLAPGIVFPRGLLDKVTSLHLQVFDTQAAGTSTGIDCSAMTAASSGVPTGPIATTTPAANQDLGTTGCAAGFKFCGTLTIPESSADRVFFAVAKDSGGNLVANGCTRTTVNQATAAVDIKMVRFIPPATCGNGIVEVGETCDPGTTVDALCNNCQTSEFTVSLPAAPGYTGGPGANAAGNRTNPSFLWPAQQGSAGNFFAFFTDKTIGRPQVAVRVLGDSLAPTANAGMAAMLGSLFLPNDPTGMNYPPQATPNDQLAPAAAIAGGEYYVAYQDDNLTGGNGYDIHLHSMDGTLTPQQPQPGCVINGAGAGEPGTQSSPAIAAGPGGALFIAWQNQATGTIEGIKYAPAAPCGALGAQQTIGAGSSNSHPVVAALPSGWVVAWVSGSDVKWLLVDQAGAPTGNEQPVGSHTGAQDSPSMASLSDGAFAIAWSDHSAAGATTVFAQRFSTTHSPLPGDQASKVNNLSAGDEIAPALAPTSAAGGAYVLAWVDSGSPNQVRARVLAGETGSLGDGSGYLFNPITGQVDEFQVSVAAGTARANPTVVVGGSGPFIAFGWEDQSIATPGITARRFPPPTQ